MKMNDKRPEPLEAKPEEKKPEEKKEIITGSVSFSPASARVGAKP
jgi:hypothetical protein